METACQRDGKECERIELERDKWQGKAYGLNTDLLLIEAKYDEAIADRDRYATLIENLKFDREEALAQVEQWRRINEGREYIITSYKIGQPSYADKGTTMIDEAREELLKILARRARKESG